MTDLSVGSYKVINNLIKLNSHKPHFRCSITVLRPNVKTSQTFRQNSYHQLQIALSERKQLSFATWVALKYSALSLLQSAETQMSRLTNSKITITVNTVILGMCRVRDFWPSRWFWVTAVIFGGLCVKSAQWSFCDANLILRLMAASVLWGLDWD